MKKYIIESQYSDGEWYKLEASKDPEQHKKSWKIFSSKLMYPHPKRRCESVEGEKGKYEYRDGEEKK